jgi:hypothetical protein
VSGTGVPGSLPIWSCSVWGLPCPLHYCRGGALLPHLFTLTVPSSPLLAPAKSRNDGAAVCFLWHFPSTKLELSLPDVIRHTALWSSDFPPPPPEWRERPSGPTANPVIIVETETQVRREPGGNLCAIFCVTLGGTKLFARPR